MLIVRKIISQNVKERPTFSADALDWVPQKSRHAETSPDPTLPCVGPTSGVPVTVSLRTAHRFPGRQPLQLQTRFAPPVKRQIGVQVDKARVSPAPGLPDPYHIGSGGPASSKRTTDPILTRRRVASTINVNVAQAGGGAVQGRTEQSGGTIHVHDGVAAGDVKRQAVVEPDALGHKIGCDARVG